MYKFLCFLLLIPSIFFSQNNDTLIKKTLKKFTKSKYMDGMNFIPGGRKVVNMGLNLYPVSRYELGSYTKNDTTLLYPNGNPESVELAPFYMSNHEVTNKEYREFINWVKDSICRVKLFKRTSPDQKHKWGTYVDQKTSNVDSSGKYFILNKKTEIDYNAFDIAPFINDLYLHDSPRFYQSREVDVRKLLFKYYWLLGEQDVLSTYQDGDEIFQEKIGDTINEVLNVYPDTLIWVKEFEYSQNDHMANMYFWHPSYDDFPVVGITHRQAFAYCNWRTKMYAEEHKKLNKKDQEKYPRYTFRLPTKNEWESAADYNNNGSNYSRHYNSILNRIVKNEFGLHGANYGNSLLKNYYDDGAFHTAKVKSYFSNMNGLYNMYGNVSEWVSTLATKPSLFQNFINPFGGNLGKTDSSLISSKDDVNYHMMTNPYTNKTHLVEINSDFYYELLTLRIKFYDISPYEPYEKIKANYISFHLYDTTYYKHWSDIHLLKDSLGFEKLRNKTIEELIEMVNELDLNSSSNVKNSSGVVDGVYTNDLIPRRIYNCEKGKFVSSPRIDPLVLMPSFSDDNQYIYLSDLLNNKFCKRDVVVEYIHNSKVIDRAILTESIPQLGKYIYLVKGGSWANEPKYLNTNASQVFNQNETSCTIGFRVVADYCDEEISKKDKKRISIQNHEKKSHYFFIDDNKKKFKDETRRLHKRNKNAFRLIKKGKYYRYY